MFHVLGQMNGEFITAVAYIATETTRFAFGLLCSVSTTPFNNGPDIVWSIVSTLLASLTAVLRTCVAARWRILVRRPPSPLFWLSNLVLSDKVLHEVVLAEASVVAVCDVACPILELSVALIFMADPIGLALERLRFLAIGKGTRKRLDIFVYVLSPIGRLVEFLHLETQWAFELGWKSFDRRQRNASWELSSYDRPLRWKLLIIIFLARCCDLETNERRIRIFIARFWW